MSWRTERRGTVTVLSFERPPANLVSFADLRELLDALARVAADGEVGLLVLAGGLPDLFIGHADRDDLARLVAGELGAEVFALWREAGTALEDLPQPTLAALGGPAQGGGSELALACTFRVGTAAASFTQHEVLRGAMPGGGATRRLPALVGASRAARMLMSGETLEAGRALEWGVLDAIVEGEDAVAGALAWAAPIAGRPPAALRALKRAIVDGARLPREEALAAEQRSFLELFASAAVAGGS